MAKIVLASHNQGKLRELREILRGRIDGLNVETDVVDASAVHAPDVPETGVSFAENSLIKARAIAEATGLIAVADDSGLSVDVLGGAPGIFSARWSGVHGDDTANLQLLLAQLADVADPHRGARFTCAAVLVQPASGGQAEQVTTIERSMEGRLVHSPQGEGGFGYDPIFVPVQEDEPGGRGRTTAQMTPEEKHAISHRGQAFRALAPVLAELLNQ